MTKTIVFAMAVVATVLFAVIVASDVEPVMRVVAGGLWAGAALLVGRYLHPEVNTPAAVARLRAELQRQASEIYFWDSADRDLLQAGPRQWTDFEGGVKLADRFDLDGALLAALDRSEK
jgi:uncharacterized membrane protein YccC